MNEIRHHLYLSRATRARLAHSLFNDANLDPHYRPFRGLFCSVLFHTSLVLLAVFISISPVPNRNSLRDQAVIIDVDDLDDILILPMLGTPRPSPAPKPRSQPPDAPAAASNGGLVYPGKQPIVSDFPDATNSTQTLLQPELEHPKMLEPTLSLPNFVRMAEPPPPAFQIPTPAFKPLTPPIAESRFRLPDSIVPAAPQPTASQAQLEVSLQAPARPFAPPPAESKIKAPELIDPVAPRLPAPPTAQLEVKLTDPSRPFAAPPVEPRIRVPEFVSQPVVPDTPQTARFDVSLQGPSRPLTAPMAESRIRTPEATTAPAVTPNTAASTPRFDVDLQAPARPLTAPLAESRLRAPETTSAPAVVPNTAASTARFDVDLQEPARPLTAPRAESRIRVPDTATSPSAVAAAPSTASVAALDVNLEGPARPLTAPRAESRLRVPDASTTAPVAPSNTARLDVNIPDRATPAAPLAPPSRQNILSLSPNPAPLNGPVVVPAGESRGRFAISPDANANATGTEPGAGKTDNSTAANGTSPVAPAIGGASTSGTAPSAGTGASPKATAASAGPTITLGTSNDAFPGITILSAPPDKPALSANTPNAPRTISIPLQTSYGIRILATGDSGGGLPSFGVFSNDEVRTVYLDMRRTIFDEVLSWTLEIAVAALPTTSKNERETSVSTHEDVDLPFPTKKALPPLSATLLEKYRGRRVIVYGIVNSMGKLEQISVKESPDVQLNAAIVNSLQEWVFTPARRGNQIVSAKVLMGIPLGWSE